MRVCKCPAANFWDSIVGDTIGPEFSVPWLGRENTVCFPTPEKQDKSALLIGDGIVGEFSPTPEPPPVSWFFWIRGVFLAYVPTSQHRSAKSAPHPQIYRTPV